MTPIALQRLARILFDLATGVAILFGAVLIAAHFRAVELASCRISTGDGHFVVQRQVTDPTWPPPAPWTGTGPRPAPAAQVSTYAWHDFGVAIVHTPPLYNLPSRPPIVPARYLYTLAGPIWPLLLAALLPVIDRLARRWRHVQAARRVRRDAGLCAACRYDLTANVSGVCPEMFSPL